MNNKELTIIIVTFNSAEIIEKCLKSFDISKYDVFVIDNNSSDKTLEIVKNSFEFVPVSDIIIQKIFIHPNVKNRIDSDIELAFI